MHQINEVAELVDRAAEGAGRAALYADHNPERTEHCAKVAKQAAESALALLMAQGATLKRQEGACLPEPIPLHLLDTPKTRELLDGLEALLPLAEAIDAERGRAWDEVVGGSAGWDLAEDLAQLIARVSLEVHGPAASVTGGRE